MYPPVQNAEFTPVLRPLLPAADRILRYLRRIDETRLYSNHGPLSVELEHRLSEHLRLPAGSLVCASSGTSAIVGGILATAGRAAVARPLAAIPAFTFVATAVAVEECGYVPYLIDIDAETWMLDPDCLAEHPERGRIGLVVPVAPFGRPVSQAPWQRFRARTGIPVVIDGAASFVGLAESPDRFLGEIPVAISFHATKVFATGEGGAVAVTDPELAGRVRQALNFGVRDVRDCRMPSTNGKMSEYHAAVGLAELDGWPDKLAALYSVAEHYRVHMAQAGIADRFYGAPDIALNYVLFRCRDAAEAQRVERSLCDAGIDCRLWYGRGLHHQSYYAEVARDGLLVTNTVAPRLIGLPVAPDLAETSVTRVVVALAAVSHGDQVQSIGLGTARQIGDPLSEEVFNAAIAEHRAAIAPTLAAVDDEITRLACASPNPRKLLSPSTDPLVRIDLNQLKCLSITRGADDTTRVGKLADWAHGMEVFKVREVLYLPDYGIPVCNGFVPEEAINYSDHLDIRLGRKPGEALTSASDCVVYPATFDRSSEEVCILGNIYSKNFGHWTEELLKVIALEVFGFDGPYVIPEWYPDFAHQSLKLLGIPPERVILVSRPIIYKAAFFTTTISHFTAHKFPGIVLRLRDRLYEAAGFEAGVGDRIWVERGRNARNGRDVVNTEEVYSCIRKYGFVSVDFGEYTLHKQIAIDRDMDVMLGPHGSAFVHCGFMATRREVIEIFSPNYINPSVIQLCSAMNHQYTQMVPVHTAHSPYKCDMDILVDIDHLKLALSSLRPRWRRPSGS